MEGSKAMLTLRCILAMATFFTALTYISRPTNNQCQMTFMMEPPRFVPIPIDEARFTPIGNEKLDVQSKKSKYTLFMYSEYGFPLESDLRRDLKDSMPVLFVPGNAGSYQQVRSLASTCIRRQLQSLDAFKFIFYTIDFRAQLSGISGQLVYEQIKFVDSALQQISKMHLMETNGVIVIGHSVGGFIAKALLARNGFDHGRVPLLINLASPLTKSFVNFDEHMRQLFIDTNSYWSRRSNKSETLAISISGGKSDRLVPMHLSLDPQYDLSITTSSIKDVWLTTDHVSITWCRELVQKLAQLLSVLMDKRQTRLIEDKNVALDIIRSQLQTEAPRYIDIDHIHIPRGKRVINSRYTETFTGYISISRNQLLGGNKVLNLKEAQANNLLIWIEHIDSLKETGLYSCEFIAEDNGQTFCEGKLNLLQLAQTIPSRRFEARKTAIMIKNKSRRIKYLVIEFATRSKTGVRTNRVPEFMSIQEIEEQEDQTLYIPTLPEYIYRRIISPDSLKIYIEKPKAVSLTQSRMRVSNLVQMHQFYFVSIKTGACSALDKSSETLVLLNRDGLVTESFHPDKTTSAVIAKLSPKESILSNRKRDSKTQVFLEFYLDGTCKTLIEIEFDWWSLIESTIQEKTTEILTCATYAAYSSLVGQISGFVNQGGSRLLTRTSWFAGLILVYAISSDLSSEAYLLDQVILLLSIVLLAIGLVALIESAIKRIVDLGIIALRFTAFIRSKVTAPAASNQTSRINGDRELDNMNRIPPKNHRTAFGINIEWSIICIVILASTKFSEALMRICMIFIVTLFQIRLTQSTSNGARRSTHNGHVDCIKARADSNDKLDRDAQLYSLLVSIATLCALSSIANIPSLLLELSSLEMNLSASLSRLNFLSSAGSLALIKIICDQLESLKSQDGCRKVGANKCNHTFNSLFHPLKQSHVLTLLPIAIIRLNICYMNCADFMALLWTASVLMKEKETLIKKTKLY